uniref:GPI ethanolamine phosphate transferase 2 C-terminal domain-containing protein n=1 Tax=Glossina pallidipes TaxID=7398 RepID=A0A1A9ZNE3_GLOPL
MDKANPSCFLFCMLTLFVSGSLLFFLGFFPASQSQLVEIYGNGNVTTKPTELDGVNLKVPAGGPKQVILLVIDALRFDFATASKMPYAYDHSCKFLSLKVDIPTVTMPRLKSIVTGAVSNFIDIVLNLGHTTALKDSLLHRLRAKEKTAVFAGDRTWIELFPREFSRYYENIDSFFVYDFFLGDSNITDTLKQEIQRNDWNFLILHYLGLDHIGHVEGSESETIFKKLLEMDSVIEYTTKNPKFENQLLLVTADHGMRNGGGHGGNEKEEVNVPIMLFQAKCLTKSKRPSSSQRNQIDLAPTLAIILDIDIPETSLSCLIPEFFDSYTQEAQLYHLLYNAQHLMNKLTRKLSMNYIQQRAYYQWWQEARNSHKHFLLSNVSSLVTFEKAKQNYMRFSKEVSRQLTQTLVEFEYDFIVIALTLTTLSALTLLLNVLFENPLLCVMSKGFSLTVFLRCCFMATIINYLCHYFNYISSRSLIIGILLTLPVAFSLYLIWDLFQLILQIILPLSPKFKAHFKLSIPSVLTTIFFIQIATRGSSSLIEEEHWTWYYLTPTLLIFLTAQNFHNNIKHFWRNQKLRENMLLLRQTFEMRNAIFLLLIIVFCRYLNANDARGYYTMDLATIFRRKGNLFYLDLILLTGLSLLWWLLRKYNSPLQMFTCLVALLSVFGYRQSPKYPGVPLVIFWCGVLTTACIHYSDICCKRGRNHSLGATFNLLALLKTNLTCCLLVSALLHDPHNVILLPALIFMLETSYQLCDNLYLKDKRLYNRSYILILKTVLTIFIANTFYFFQGNSNKLSTININPGYIGLKSYNALLVGSLITLNMYCAQINAYLYLVWHMFNTQVQTLPIRQEKEQITNMQLFESTEEDLYLVLNLYTTTTVVPVAVYWWLLIAFRYHLFIYSVYAPKAIYECFQILVFYLNFIITTLYFKLFK